MTRISHEKPPIYDECVRMFGVSWDDGVIFTYGDTIHAKEGVELTGDVIAHELVHMEQQKGVGPERWWIRYLNDPGFRLRSETEAYRVQYMYALEHYNSKFRKRLLHHMAGAMARLYGGICTYDEALSLITSSDEKVQDVRI